MTREPLVSILMNCYNGEQYLKEAVDSVLDQTYRNWELVFWDNQSTDRTAEIFKNYDKISMKVETRKFDSGCSSAGTNSRHGTTPITEKLIAT